MAPKTTLLVDRGETFSILRFTLLETRNARLACITQAGVPEQTTKLRNSYEIVRAMTYGDPEPIGRVFSDVQRRFVAIGESGGFVYFTSLARSTGLTGRDHMDFATPLLTHLLEQLMEADDPERGPHPARIRTSPRPR